VTKDAAAASEAEDVDLGERFARLATRPGGRPRKAAIQRAQDELVRIKPALSQLIVTGCRDLESALAAASSNDQNRAHYVQQAHAISESLRDAAGSLGFPFIGLIASNLCKIFETVNEADIPYPLDVVNCHTRALRLAQNNLSQPKMTADLEKLAAGLAQTVQLIENAAASRHPFQTPSPSRT